MKKYIRYNGKLYRAADTEAELKEVSRITMSAFLGVSTACGKIKSLLMRVENSEIPPAKKRQIVALLQKARDAEKIAFRASSSADSYIKKLV